MTTAEYVYRPMQVEADAWDRLVADAPHLSLIQTGAFSDAKAAAGPWQAERGLIWANGSAVGATQAMVRKIPGMNRGLAWVNRGPFVLGDADDAPSHQAGMLAALNAHFADERGLYLRIAPMCAAAAFDDQWAAATGLRITETLGWSSAIVDLQQSPETLRKGLHGKWRNALKQAEQADISVRQGSDNNLFTAFLAGHREQSTRLGDDIGISADFLEALQAGLPDDRKIYVLLADVAGMPAGGIAIAKFGQTGEYIAGHNNDVGRKHNAGQRLLWAAMMHLQNAEFGNFDLGGMDEKLTPPGIFRFKDRVGGAPYRLANELEGGFEPFINRLIRWRVTKARMAI